MSAIKKNKTQSERLINIDWRDDPDHDSSRNPVVEASQAVNLDDSTTVVNADDRVSFADQEELYVDDSFLKEPEATKAADATVRDSSTSQVFDVVVDRNAEPNMVADSGTTSFAKPSIDFPKLEGQPASVQIDQVFKHIAPYAAVIDNKISETSLLGRSLLAQANAVFNTAFLNLQAKIGYTEIYADAPSADSEYTDITSFAVDEVMRLQHLA